jgi:hypothetical protein
MNMQFLQQLDHIAEAIRDQCERRKFPLLSGFSILYLVNTCLLASWRLMWNDELYTFYFSRLPNVSDVWAALSTGADQIPPLFHIITRTSFSLFGVNHLSIRLPEVLGFWVMSLCLFWFVSRRSAALYGFAAMLFPLITVAYDYAYEARPYGLVLGFCGLALLCWQSAAEGLYRKLSLIGLAVSFAAAVSSHYYAVLLFFPLAVGEVVRACSRRHLDLPIWLALGSAMTPLALFLPLIEGAKTYHAHFWSPPRWESIPGFFYFLLLPAGPPLVAMLMLSAIYLTSHPMATRRCNRVSRPAPPYHELVAAVGFVAIPVVAVIVAKLVVGAFTFRYALPAVMGLSILLAFAASRLLDGRAIMGVALVFFSCSWFLVMDVLYFKQTRAVSVSQAKAYRFLQSESESELPIVVADIHTFMKLVHYAPRDLAARFVYLAAPEAALHHLGSTTVDRGMLDLQPWFDVRVEEYGSYIASHQRFLVLARFFDDQGKLWNRGQNSKLAWLLFELTAAGRQIELRAQNEDDLLFLVSSKQRSEDSGSYHHAESTGPFNRGEGDSVQPLRQ